MKNLFILFICFFSVSTAFSQNWIGTTGNWDDPSNWSDGQVPGLNNGLIIDGASFDVTIPANFIADAKSIRLLSGATLTIESGACLTLGGGSTFALTIGNGSTFTNNGTVNATNNNYRRAATFSGTVINNGTLNFDDCGSNDPTRGSGMRITGGSFENNGDVNIGPNITDHGIDFDGSATITNNGQFNILGAGPDATDKGFHRDSGSPTFINAASGTLCIEDANVPGDLIDALVTFTDNGTYNTSGCAATGTTVACSQLAVPTMGEWALIIFGLIVLSFGAVYVMRWSLINQKQFA